MDEPRIGGSSVPPLRPDPPVGAESIDASAKPSVVGSAKPSAARRQRPLAIGAIAVAVVAIAVAILLYASRNDLADQLDRARADHDRAVEQVATLERDVSRLDDEVASLSEEVDGLEARGRRLETQVDGCHAFMLASVRVANGEITRQEAAVGVLDDMTACYGGEMPDWIEETLPKLA